MPDKNIDEMTKSEICIEIVNIIQNNMITEEGSYMKHFCLEDYNPSTEIVLMNYWGKGLLDYEQIKSQKGILKAWSKNRTNSDYDVPFNKPQEFCSINLDEKPNKYPKDNRPFHEKLLIVLRQVFPEKKEV